jgi:hypothetical protein
VSILRAEGWAGVVHSGQLSPLGFTRSGDLLADKTFEHDSAQTPPVTFARVTLL